MWCLTLQSSDARKETLLAGLLKELILDSQDVLNEFRNYRDSVVNKYELPELRRHEAKSWASLPESGLEREEALRKKWRLSISKTGPIHHSKKSYGSRCIQVRSVNGVRVRRARRDERRMKRLRREELRKIRVKRGQFEVVKDSLGGTYKKKSWLLVNVHAVGLVVAHFVIGLLHSAVKARQT